MIEPRGHPKVWKGPKPEPVEVREETDGTVADGVVTAIRSRKQSDGYADKRASLQVATNRQQGFLDLWHRMGCLVQSSPRVLLADVLDNRDWVKLAEFVDLDGLPCLHATCECADGNNVETWLSIRHGFMVKHAGG